ncbi:nucleolar protein 6 [Cryptococcus deuterogattii R265]|uniref:nucleolar protein 6 n=1 Tax=Cryptococcus deuterogattii (strain R265) TaxID=294750 RepID=UPI00193831A9|nr:nucleolar protein 6 [Cryptococcus deuterogattii R265]
MSAPLTKKQQKAAAFRSKQKAKKAGVEAPPDLPEEDVVEDAEAVAEEQALDQATKKRKRNAEDENTENAGTVEEAEMSVKPKNQEKKKRKTAWDEEGEGESEGKKGKGKKDAKQRFILFVGNLSFKTTKEEIQKHFEPAAGQLPSVRLLTTKATPTQSAKSRGIAFLELPSSTVLQACLKLHHSELKGRTINVELTAGGGGSSEDRKKKILERNQRVGGQRERRAEREKEINGGEGEDVVEGKSSEQNGDDEKKTKMRGGRRVKAKAAAPVPSSAPHRPSTSFASSRPPAREYPGGKFQKRKWEPTGANSISVGQK